MIRSLQQDNRASKAIFAVVIGFAILAMVVTLVPGIFDNSSVNNGQTFATVRGPGWFGRFGDSNTITNAEVENAARSMLQRNQLPDMYLPLVMAQAGQQQVERAILVREANHLGLQVSNEDLARELRNGPLGQYLFPNGEFIGQDRYESFISQQFGGLSIIRFEAEVKEDMELQRLEALVTGNVNVSEQAARAAYLKQGQKAKFDYAVLSANDLKKTIQPSDAELEKFFHDHASMYATAVPEQRKLQFFQIDTSNLPGGAPKVTDADVQAYYNAHQADYKVPEEVKTRHILFTVPKGADASADAAVKAKAADVLKQVRAGGNFAELAKKYSEDPGSKDQGGDLPLIPTSNLDPSYARAAMALSPGQTSDLVRSQFGYHIIQTEQKQAAATKSLADVRDEISGKLSAQKFVAAQTAFAGQLANEAAKNGMEATAKAHNLNLVTTDDLSRTGSIPSLPDSSSLLSAAFTAAKNGPPQTASTGEGDAVFRVLDVKPAHAPAFADWKSHVLDDFRDQRAPELLSQQLAKLDALAKQTGDLRKAAAQMNIPVKTSDLVGRDGQVQDVGSMAGAASSIFDLPKGGISAPISEGPNGVVAQLLELDQPSAPEIAVNVGTVRDKLLDEQRAESFNVFAGTLLQRYTSAGAVVYSRKPATGLPAS